MGVEIPISPIMMVAAAPEGVPPRRIRNDISKNTELPRRAPRGALMRGAIVKTKMFF